MQTRHIGRSGLKVTTVGLGCNNFGWKIDQQASNSVVAQALNADDLVEIDKLTKAA